MSKLDELIQKLCPNGVEWKTLEELGVFLGGLTGKSKDDFKDGNANFITYMNVFSNPGLNLHDDAKVKIAEGENQRRLEYGDIIFTGSSEIAEECAYTSVVCEVPEEDYYLNSFCFILRLYEVNLFNPHFLKHLFRSSHLRNQLAKTANGVTRFNVSKEKMKKVRIPVPPMEVQCEIVHILDQFTLLTAELTAELTARKQQYDHYREELLSLSKLNDENVVVLSLNDIYEFQYGDGNTIPENKGIYPVYGSNGWVGTYNDKYNSEDSPVIGHIGAYAGIVNYAKGKHFVTYNGVICKHFNKKVNVRFAYHLLKNQNFLAHQKGPQPFISYDLLRKTMVKIPPMEKQIEIANVLDKFDTYCNDLTQGLPAEIELRKQQYEYYRDKLLSFKELK